ncbi:Hypp6706 [Branchiostoma lanceolatum]|uniref:Hypp6706 protein n=1 Tax=Branchiostoma lanceolatum TaxID=7740 RepID=A0A8J9YVH1_BRALA|nr:Hypp6706 [Branchiostoma lanceolatum]
MWAQGFDEQTIMARTGHRSTAVRAYKRPSDTLLMDEKDTHYVESFNNAMLVYHDKRINFGKRHYMLRVNLAILDWGPESVLERTYDTFQEKIRKMMLEDNLMCSLFSKGKGQILRVSAALWLLFHAVDKPDKVSNSLDSGLSLPTVIPERVVSAAVAVVTYSIHQTGLLHGRRHNEDAGTVDNSTTDVPRKPASLTDVPHLESASTSRRTTNFGGQTLLGSILLVPGRVLSVKNLLTKRFFKTRGKKEVADTMLAMQDQHLGEVNTLSHRGGQRVYFVKHDILGLPDADKTAAIVALAQHGVNIKEYADTLVDSEAEGDMNKSIEANEVIAGEKRKLCAPSTMLSPLCDADDDDDFAPTTNKRRSI